MSYQRERDEFIAIMAKEGVLEETARRIMRAATTLHRLAEDDCNGVPECHGYPRRHLCYPQGHPKSTRETYCGESFVTAENVPAKVLTTGKISRTTCPSCKATRLEQSLLKYVNERGLSAVFSGDPRGAVVKLAVPSGKTNDWGQVGICVPTRG